MAKLSAHGRTEIARFQSVKESGAIWFFAVMSDGKVLTKTKFPESADGPKWSTGWTIIRALSGKTPEEALSRLEKMGYERV